MSLKPIRPGETTLDFDPGERADVGLAFLGRIRSPWDAETAPKNIARARETGQPARIELDPAYREGLTGLAPDRWIIVTYWMDRGRRDLIVQRPGHVDGPRGTFALRSPMRPNLIAMSTVRITAIEDSTVHIDAIDCFDRTPVVDIRPWIPTVDVPPGWTPE